MAELITGDRTKGIKNVGELALRISRFDGYRLFTLYENVKDGKIMNISGNQKYYLVFRSPNKEIRIPEYEPNGFFEVDKVNGCVLFKITKKNAEDILGMKTAGEKIFYIIRVFEETDGFGRVLSVTDEVEVYHGKWGDDDEFTTFTTENKVDLLTKSLAAQVDKNAAQMNEYRELMDKYNSEVVKNNDYEKELEKLRQEIESLQETLSAYTSNTYDGTLLSTDTKYIAFEDTLDKVTFTEEQYQKALGELMTKGEVDFTDDEFYNDADEPKINLDVKVIENEYDIEITVYKNGEKIGRAMHGLDFSKLNDTIDHGTEYSFEYTGGKVKDTVTYEREGPTYVKKTTSMYMQLEYGAINEELKGAVKFSPQKVKLDEIGNNTAVKLNLKDLVGENSDDEVSAIGVIGGLRCRVISETK